MVDRNSHARKPKPRPNYFSLPNEIFRDGLTPYEFVVYAFLISARDPRKDLSYWSVKNIAKNCGMCKNTCRKVLHSLESKGYVDISSRYLDHVQQTNIYTVTRDYFEKNKK